jgi:hypothetical protein
MIGSVVAGADTLIILTSKHWNVDVESASEQNKLVAQKEKLREQANDIVMRWVQQREMIGFLITYYHSSDTRIQESWAQLRLAVDNVVACAQSWHLEHIQAPSEIDDACQSEKDNLRAAWAGLTLKMGENSQHGQVTE